MTPYYQQSGVTIYHGDCREVMDEWEGLRTQSFDLLLTDPPYGLNEAAGKNKSRGKPSPGLRMDPSKVFPARDYGTATWDARPAMEDVATARRLCRWHAIFGGNYYELPPSRCWLVWDKDNGACDFADCELIWTNFNKAVRKLTYRWNGMLQEPGCARDDRQHPTQKPEAVMRWALMQAPQDVKTVLDPFMGSGTTLVACKRLGRSVVGIDREERYCEIAARRCQQEVLPLDLVAT